MTAITLGSSTTAPSDANELSKLIIWTIERARNFQPDLKFLLPYEEIDDRTGLPITVNRPTAWVQRKVIWTYEGAGLITDYGCRYRAYVAIPLIDDYNQVTGKFWTKTDLDIIDENSPTGATNTFAVGTGGDIPSTIDTYPKLILWLAEALRTVTSGQQIFEDNPYQSVPIGSINLIENTPHGDVAFCRFSVPVPTDHLSQAAELYSLGLVASSVSLPDSFKS